MADSAVEALLDAVAAGVLDKCVPVCCSCRKTRRA